MGKNSLTNFICHLSWLKKLCPCSYTSPHIYSWTFDSLRVIIFWVRVTHKVLNVNWEKIHSIILSATLSWLKKLSPTHDFVTPPHPFMTHPTPPPPHPFMTHPPHPHPTPSWPTHPTLPHPHPFMTHPPYPYPTPGTFLGTKDPFSWAASLCLPLGRQ